jgi:hypothetical protein
MLLAAALVNKALPNTQSKWAGALITLAHLSLRRNDRPALPEQQLEMFTLKPYRASPPAQRFFSAHPL